MITALVIGTRVDRIRACNSKNGSGLKMKGKTYLH
ncbi:hypothetical protein F441_00093 [Phytophthora nicotianae CJ01A1]|nr:hypothetical protein L915_00089 [Phytophthora nicotianae]ETL50710.1 hypothetical protein L916_00084 [Phytophthora nicotianae]ETM03745.1 hypothetical protein L917_00075 [Phytophthora nicotianae]ETO86369.1 hypothetical protein F444_00087 [Phytophthora nicotianae P1976]ETP27398.1 hypothetical protein F441_00093 [Phytophthora nicotianae CJ01A1]